MGCWPEGLVGEDPQGDVVGAREVGREVDHPACLGGRSSTLGWGGRGTSAGRATAPTACLADDLDALVAICATRCAGAGAATNLLERSPGEVQRRTKVIGRFPSETSCLSLVWAMSGISSSPTPPTNGITFTDIDRQRLYQIRYQPAPTSNPHRCRFSQRD
jgi:hypothetical protein